MKKSIYLILLLLTGGCSSFGEKNTKLADKLGPVAIILAPVGAAIAIPVLIVAYPPYHIYTVVADP